MNKTNLIRGLMEHGYKLKYIESEFPDIEDDMIRLLETNLHINICDDMANVAKVMEDGKIKILPYRDTVQAIMRDMVELSN